MPTGRIPKGGAVGDPNRAKSALSTNRQAVILIHGVGNQRPMDTLRHFVDATLNVDPDTDRDPQYYSKPDNLSGTFELRRLQTRDARPRTDYFELYWQHLVPTATWSKILAWLALLLKRKPADVPPMLRWLWALTWVVVGATLLLLALSIVLWLFPGVQWIPAWLNREVSYPIGLAALLLLIQGVILNYVGDAAIYLSPEPRNIKARQAVREAGVTLIARLHDGLDQKTPYDRIVVVGHSLGSVIGYDILTYAWPGYNTRHGRPERPSNAELAKAESLAKKIRDAERGGDLQALREAQTDWAQSIRRLWLEQRKNGIPWLVSDFITLGSPLAHALLLLARSRSKFERKKLQRELPTSPPQLEDKGDFSYPSQYTLANGKRRTLKVLNHAALFAVTRWTNLFFPARYALMGDLIAGKVSSVLGAGIQDLPVETTAQGGWLLHTRYWQPHAWDRGNHRSSIEQLVKALDINRLSFRKLG
jgi:hypothetical protein